MSFNSNTTSATGVAGTVCPSEVHEFNPGVCVCFPSVGAMLYQAKLNVELELLSIPEHLQIV